VSFYLKTGRKTVMRGRSLKEVLDEALKLAAEGYGDKKFCVFTTGKKVACYSHNSVKNKLLPFFRREQ
jgi:hypothetical protein